MSQRKEIDIEKLNERLKRSILSEWGNIKSIGILKAPAAVVARVMATEFDRYIRLSGIRPDSTGAYVFSLPIGFVRDLVGGRVITRSIREALRRYKFTLRINGPYYTVMKLP